MKKDIHPAYHPVLYVDAGGGFEFTSRSTQKSNETRKIDGVDHYVLRLEVSSASHPYYTGKQKFVDAAGRIEKFQKKFAGKYGSAASKAAGTAARDLHAAEKAAATATQAARTAEAAKNTSAAGAAKK